MFMDKAMSFNELTVGSSNAYTEAVDFGDFAGDNTADGVALPDFFAVATAIPEAGDPDTTSYTISLQFSQLTGEAFSSAATVPMIGSTLRSQLTAGRYVTNPRPLLRVPYRYCRVAVYPTGTARTGAKFKFGFGLNAYKPDSGI